MKKVFSFFRITRGLSPCEPFIPFDMKKCMLFIFVSMMLLSTRTWAQIEDYHPFLKEGKIWVGYFEETVSDVVEGKEESFIQKTEIVLRLNGDTIVNGGQYKKMDKYTTNVERIQMTPEDKKGTRVTIDVNKKPTREPLFWRETGRKVFLYDDRKKEEKLYYDFSLKEGDIFDANLVGGTDMTVCRIDTIRANGRYFRRFHLSGSDRGSDDVVWVEGIGHCGFPYCNGESETDDDKHYQFLSCRESGELIFTNNDFNNESLTLTDDSYDNKVMSPMLVDGRTWVYEYHHFEEQDSDSYKYTEELHQVSYCLSGDTLIEGTNYRKMMRSYDDGDPVYYGAYREAYGDVYCIEKGNTTEELLISFVPEKVVQLAAYDTCKGIVDEINVNGRSFRRHVYTPTSTFESPLYAVEGIGFSVSGLVEGVVLEMVNCICDYQEFSACYEDGECIFTKDDFFLPYGVDGIEPVVPVLPKKGGLIYDLQGRRLQGEPKHGVYIQNGKKVMR